MTRRFVANHPIVVQFLILVAVVFISLPLWVAFWIVLTAALGFGIFYFALPTLPFLFAGFVFQVSGVSGWITNSTLRWAGINPKVALL